MRRLSFDEIIADVDSEVRSYLLDDLDLPGTLGLVRFEQLAPGSTEYGEVVVNACGPMHKYPTFEAAYAMPPGYSVNTRLTPVGYYDAKIDAA